MFTLYFPHLLRSHRARRMVALAVMVFAFPASTLANSYWSVIASTGEVDENCAGNYELAEDFRLIAGNSPSVCTIRHEVVDTWYTDGFVRVRLHARIQDNGDAARTIVRLRSYDFTLAKFALVATIDSNSYGVESGYRTRWPECTNLNFNTHTYWIETELHRSATAVGAPQGTPGLQHLRFHQCSTNP